MFTETFNVRWDRTGELLGNKDANRWKRRLDSIARLVENASTCAAVAVEGGSFLIATNKNFVEYSTDQGYLLINSVMSFFKSIAEGQEPTQDDFRKVFAEICKGAMSGLQLPAYLKRQLAEDSFIDKVMTAGRTSDFRGLRDYIAEQLEIGHYPSDQASAFVVCSALLTDFQKVIKFIQDNKHIHDDPRTGQFINAIKNYDASNIIDRQKLDGKVADSEKMHAEMRILALMEGQLKDSAQQYENYIGISKLCCLDCHAMIYAVNNSNYGNTIEIRGAHNVKHSGNWRAPFNITEKKSRLAAAVVGGGTRGSSNPDPFSQTIVAKFYDAHERATSDANTAGAFGVSEYADHSGSSSGDAEESILTDISLRLSTKKQELERLPAISGIAIEPIVYSTIGLLLNHLSHPETPLGLSLKNYVVHLREEDIAGYLFALRGQENLSEEPNDTANRVIAILKNKELVGERVSSAFSKLTLSRLPQDDHGFQVAQTHSSSPPTMPLTSVINESSAGGGQGAREDWLATLALDLNEKCLKNNGQDLRDWIQQVCDAKTADVSKKDLMDTLLQIQHPDLMKIFEVVARDEKSAKSLLLVMSESEFSDQKYANLRDMANNKLESRKDKGIFGQQKETLKKDRKKRGKKRANLESKSEEEGDASDSMTAERPSRRKK